MSGQIYQIPPWNGPVYYNSKTNKSITIYSSTQDSELRSLASMILAMTESGSIQSFLFQRVYSVFKHEYCSNISAAIKCALRYT